VKKNYLAPVISLLSVAMMPMMALAHGHTSFEINERVYMFTVGSLNEPVAVDDKTGVDLRVTSMSRREHEEGEMSGEENSGAPVLGLEKTLKVELMAGNQKKVQELSTVYGTPGAYKTIFIPTVQTTFSYRVFGMIDNVPFDHTFICNPAGHPVSPEDKTEVKVSEGVTRILSSGAFGCPVAKADLGFPEKSASTYDLVSAHMSLEKSVSGAMSMAVFGILLGLVGVGLGVFLMMKGRRGPGQM
jgi:hypothetical protein